MQTVTGRAFYPLDPRPSEIRIEDIAGALAKLCRYGGHCQRFYSVAEHCWHIARHPDLPRGLRLTALMHDAAEAYVGDVIRPIKPFLADYGEIESGVERAIAERFGLAWPRPPLIKELDVRILRDELEQVMARPPQPWFATPGTGLGVKIHCFGPRAAERMFLAAFKAFGGKA